MPKNKKDNSESDTESDSDSDSENEDNSVEDKQWPATTKRGTQCKRCIKKGSGVFCFQHK